MCKFLDMCPEEEVIMVDLEGIIYHPDTNVSAKVIDSVMADIIAITYKGGHSISVRRGSNKMPCISYRLPQYPTIWEQIAHLTGYPVDVARERVIDGSKANNKYIMSCRLGVAI